MGNSKPGADATNCKGSVSDSQTKATETRSSKPLGDNLSAMDVAGAMAGMSERCYHFALAKYCSDSRSANKLWELMRELAAELWPKISTDQATALALISMESVLWSVQCRTCKGTKMIMKSQTKYVECTTCNGTGIGRTSGRKCASMLGISETAFRKTWNDRVAILQYTLSEYDYLATKHIRAKIG